MHGIKKLAYFLLSYAAAMALLASAGEIAPAGTLPVRIPRLKDLVPFSGEAGSVKMGPSRGQQRRYLYCGEDSRYLSRFFTKLGELKSGRRKTLRIMHFGDSLIWADNFSSTLRQRFQKDFGDGGRGLVPAAHLPYTILEAHVNRTAPGEFTVNRISHRFYGAYGFRIRPEIDRALGFTGESCRALYPGSTVRLEAPSEGPPWATVGIHVRLPDTGPAGLQAVKVNLKIDGREESRTVSLYPGGAEKIEFHLIDARKLDINFAGSAALPYVDGINLETGKGVAYSTFVRMGTHLSWLSAVPETEMVRGMKEFSPDLVIFQYGINEAASLNAVPAFTEKDLREQMTGYLAMMKRTLPDTDFLIIGPPERLISGNAGLEQMKETMTVIAAQKDAAGGLGMAFFDTYAFLGGEGQMKDMVARGLAIDDYMHLTRRGGAEVGGRVYGALYREYLKFTGHTGAETGPDPGVDLTSSDQRSMEFNSRAFAYFFVLVAFALFLAMGKNHLRTSLVLAASVYFYLSWETWPLLLMLGTVVVDYSAGRMIYRSRKRGGRGTVYLLASLGYNLGVLAFFKYSASISGALSHLLSGTALSGEIPLIHAIMPAGISFYTFKSLSYSIDIWRGNMVPERRFLDYAGFVTFFPQILAGPISRARDFLPRRIGMLRRFRLLNSHYPRLASDFVSGAIFLILAGLMKKAGADWLGANVVDRVYGNPSMFSSLETLAAVFAYGAQIYADFSGYSDIAIGCASLLGFRIPDNFNRPYMSESVTDFWRRWHITLGTWFREYVYIGLGGNRKRVYFNLLVTMLLCGIWHGSGLNFAVWGLYHGVFLALERMTGLHRDSRGGKAEKFFRIGFTFLAVLFGWIIFRAESWENFAGILNALGSFTLFTPNLGFSAVAVISAFYIFHFTPVRWKRQCARLWRRLPAPVMGVAAAAVTVFLLNAATAGVRPFIYLRF